MPSEATNRANNRLALEPIWAYQNLTQGLQVQAPHRRWVADLTSVQVPEGLV